MQHEDTQDERRHLRRTFFRVMVVQLVTLALLWLLQSRYAS
jgi:hypothetical protein